MALTKKKPKHNIKLNRKQLRKEQRKQKKEMKNEYFLKRKMSNKKPGQFVLNPEIKHEKKLIKSKENNVSETQVLISTEKIRKREQKQQKILEKQMKEQRIKQFKEDNIKEDRAIKRLEKLLKLNKRKTKSLPKSFTTDGLDYLLEVVDPERMKDAVEAEKQLFDAGDDFEEDFELMLNKNIESHVKESNTLKKYKDNNKENEENLDYIEEINENSDFDDISENIDFEKSDSNSESSKDEFNNSDMQTNTNIRRNKQKIQKINEAAESKSNKTFKSKDKLEDAVSDFENDDFDIEDGLNDFQDVQDENDDSDDKNSMDEENENISDNDNAISTNFEDESEVWEDIYGRKRGKDGSILQETKEGKYIPPAIRAKKEASQPQDKKRQEQLNRLRKQLKGLFNRLAESNMHSIASQIEELYMKNSRNDMNETITNLVMDAIVSNILAPERLLMEHVLLIVILHANIGTEIGANFLQSVVKKFSEFHKANRKVEDKRLDNIVNILAQLYNFRLFDAKLLYEILKELAEKFEEKDVECILHILRSVGFSLRKDNPLALKNLIFDLQKRASNASDVLKDNSRVKFMLDILLAIKNNNVTKIPNYDTSYSQHLKKVMKGFIRRGNYVTQLNISLEDLLKAEERGKWWIVGSAWTGNINQNSKVDENIKTDGFSEKLLRLARKQRMNTDTRRNIFCIIMSAEDYLDAFEKLLKLGLKNQQDREIINVLLHCCLQEKVYNPYYSFLAQKFCEYDRKYQMTIKCSIWDKLKALSDHSSPQLSNLAKLLTHLFIEKGLPISTLKIVQFSQLDKITLRFMRQILLGILLHNDQEACNEIFKKVAQSDKLKIFRESLRLFIYHFVLKNLKNEIIPQEQKILLETRAKMIQIILNTRQNRF